MRIPGFLSFLSAPLRDEREGRRLQCSARITMRAEHWIPNDPPELEERQRERGISVEKTVTA
jgi:hypothetical protein